MDDIVLVKVIDGVENLANCLSGVLFRELSLLADPVKQLSTGGQLSDNVVLVLCESQLSTRVQPQQRNSHATRTSRGT